MRYSGATPFATVSSRISQHFKRAAEHNPPRPPLLARHFDENHSRKINYSLATEPSPEAPQTTPPPATATTQLTTRSSSRRKQPTNDSHKDQPQPQPQVLMLSDTSPPTSDDEQQPQEQRAPAKRKLPQRRHASPPATRASRRRSRRDRSVGATAEDDADDETESTPSRRGAKRVRHHNHHHHHHHHHHHNTHPPATSSSAAATHSLPLSPVTASSSASSVSSSSLSYSPPSQKYSKTSHSQAYNDSESTSQSALGVPPVSPPTLMDQSDEDSEAEYSDYHEEMLKGDETMADIEFDGSNASTHANHAAVNRDRRRSSITSLRRPSVAQVAAADMNRSVSAQPSLQEASPRLSARRPSFSMNGNYMGEDLWNYNNFDPDFDTAFMSDDSAAVHHLPYNIATPESVSVAELEAYFNGDGNSSSSAAAAAAAAAAASSSSSSSSTSAPHPTTSARTTSRKSFSALMGSRETSLLQKALLASTARGARAAHHRLPTAVADDSTPLQSPTAATASAATTTTAAAAAAAEDDNIPLRPRRKSWPDEYTTSGTFWLDDAESNEEHPSQPTQPAAPAAAAAKVDAPTATAKDTAVDADRDVVMKDKESEKKEETEPSRDSPAQESQPTEKTYSSPGHRFKISKKTFGPLECYQLESPDDLLDTKVLRFIQSTDGASEHVALRTRHAAEHQRDRRNSQHFYLDEGYVNATHLRKAARPVLGKGSFDTSAELEEGRVVVTLTKGPLECRGAW